MPDDIILLPSEAPAPLEIFEQEKIHPDNQALLEARLARFHPLPRKERIRLEKRRDQLWKLLNQRHYNLLIELRAARWQEFTEARAFYYQLIAEVIQRSRWLAAHLQPGELEAAFAALLRSGISALAQVQREARLIAADGSALNHRLEDLKPLHDEYTDVRKRLEESEQMIRDEKERLEEERKFREEARIIETLLLDTFARTPRTHHVWYDTRGRRHMDTPHFQLSDSDADSHWFLLAASEKAPFGWRSILPYGVDVLDLVSEVTLENLSVAIGMQVEARRSEQYKQVWLRVNRLDSPDGLPRYFVFRSMLELYPKALHDLIPYPVGVFENRRVRWFNLKDEPHLFVGGKTTSGKSNYLNTVLSTWIQMHSPQELQLVLIDNKGGVEFSHYRNIPHLLTDFVKDLRQVKPTLMRLNQIKAERLAILEASGKKEIWEYNESVEPEQRLSQIVLVIDEMQSLLSRGRWTRRVHHLLSVLTAEGRAAGIHIILCTQFPSKEVVPMSIKANIGAYVIFKMSQHAFMTILPEKLPREFPKKTPGRAIIIAGQDLEPAQISYISTEEVDEAVRLAVRRFGTRSAPKLIEPAIEPDEDSEPTAPVLMTFEESDLLALALDKFNGELRARPIFKSIQPLQITTRERVETMIKTIVERGYVNYQDVRYRLVLMRGNFYKLIEIAPTAEEVTEAAQVDMPEVGDPLLTEILPATKQLTT